MNLMRLNQNVTLPCKQQRESQASHVDFQCPKPLVLKVWGLVPLVIKRSVKSDHGLCFIPSLTKIVTVRHCVQSILTDPLGPISEARIGGEPLHLSSPFVMVRNVDH